MLLPTALERRRTDICGDVESESKRARFTDKSSGSQCESTDDDLESSDEFPRNDYQRDPEEGCDVASAYPCDSDHHVLPDVTKASSHFMTYNHLSGPYPRLTKLPPEQLALGDVMASLSKLFVLKKKM